MAFICRIIMEFKAACWCIEGVCVCSHVSNLRISIKNLGFYYGMRGETKRPSGFD